mgnify:CR=1 FL=1
MSRNETPGVGDAERTGVMGKWSLLAMGIGVMIGAGIVTLTGQSIGLTGYSTWLAFVIALVLGFIYNIPAMFVTSAVRVDGGPYALVSTVLGRRFGGMYIIGALLFMPGVALYCTSLAGYVVSLLPGLDKTLVTLAILTIFYIINLCGIKAITISQNVMTSLLVAALMMLAVLGMGKVDFSLLNPGKNPEFYLNGSAGLMDAALLLMFSTYGTWWIMFFSRHAKHPKKDIPFAFIGTTIVITIVYVSVSIVASGILPISVTANAPLTYVAKEVLPDWLYILFMVGGPLMALATTINGCFTVYTEPIYVATRNGWFPQSFGKTTKQGVPWKILTLMYLTGLIPIALKWDINMITNCYMLINLIVAVLMMASFALVPSRYPQAWADRQYRIPTWLFYVFVALAVAVQLYVIYSKLQTVKWYVIVITIVDLVFGYFYATKLDKKGQVITPSIELQ